MKNLYGSSLIMWLLAFQIFTLANSLLPVEKNSNSFLMAKMLLLSAPNGGEIWQAGTQKTISWVSNEIEFIRIEFTSNNGATWNVIRNSIAANEGSVQWSIPTDVSSAISKVRIYDISDPSLGDSSDNVFTIKRLEVTSPTLGTKFQIGTTRSINWIASNTIDTVQIQYSTNNGLTWQTVVSKTAASAGTYSWFVPNTTTTSQARIRITDIIDNSIVANSSQFSISSLNITSPIGGENWFGGSSRAITWQSGNVNKIKIEYSTNNGTNWLTITDSTNAGPGSYSWTVPSAPTAQALIRLTDIASNSVQSISDNVFSISALAITSPNGGEGLQIDSVRQVTWSTNLSSNIRIELSTNNGLTWPIVLKDSIDASLLSYTFTVPNNPSSNGRIRLISTTDATINDVSDASFTIGNVAITSPIGGNYQAGSSLQIDWTSTQGISTSRLDYSLDNGVTWNSIISSTPSSHIGTNNFVWNIPSNVSADFARIRVSDASTGTSISRISQAFSISRLEITNNFSNQVYLAGTNITLNWLASSNITNVAIYYSGDNGNTWDAIPGAVVPASNLTYTWTTPSNLSLSEGRFRLVAQNNTSIVAISQNTFRVGSVTLTYPTATGIRLLGGQQANITWTASASISFVRLEYSLDNGTSWNVITNATPSAAGTYAWTLPAAAANNTARVRVLDAFSAVLIDESDHNFTIVTLTLTSPAGRIGMISGSTQSVTWTSSGITQINIQFSPNGGTSWIDLDTSVNAALGTRNVTIPSNVITDAGKIRIIEKGNSDFFATHPNELRVDKISVQETVPTSLQVDSVYTIRWDPVTVIQNLRIELSTDNGVTWPITVTPSTPASTLGYNWTVTNNPSSNARFRLSDADFSTINNNSQTSFSIKRLTLTSPNGGEFLQVGSTHSMTWDRSSNIANIKIEYSTNNGSSWITVTNSTAANTGSYSWVIPDSFTITGRVRITDVAASNIYDFSNSNFTISSLRLTSPNGGEIYAVNSNQLIQWQTHPTVANVRIELSTDGGATFPNVITASTPANSGSYNWAVSNFPGTNIRLRISDVARDFIADTSDNSFTIRSLRITYPNGGEKLQAGKTDTLRWSSINTVTNVKIDYTTNNGNSWVVLEPSRLASTEFFVYTVPNTPTDSARFRISSTDDATISDISDNRFNIASLQVINPNGGENLSAGSNYTIRWNSQQIANVKIDYLPDGVTPQTIAASVSASLGEFVWTVPMAPTSLGRIRVYDASNESTSDISDAPFSIINLNLNSPIGGEGWRIGTTKNITWTSSGIANVRIDYSINNGSTWNTIVNSVAANLGTYAWLVPDSASNRVRVRLVNLSDQTVMVSSPSAFTIGSITLTNLTGGNQIQANRDTLITWNAKGFDNVRIDYAADGINFNQIVTSSTIASAGSFRWTIPASATTNGRIRISDAETNLGIVDSSVGLIKISSLGLTSPTSGIVWQSGTNHVISWNSGAINNINIELSTNNGNTWLTIANSLNAALGGYVWNGRDNLNNLLSTSQALIRISDASNSAVNSTVSGNFRLGWLQVTSPIAAQVVQGGTTSNITWNTSNSISDIALEYSTDGVAWNSISNSVSAASGTYTWLVPTNLSSSTVRVRIKDAVSDSISATSGLFTVTQLSITSPNGNEKWQSGTAKTITWNNSPTTINVKLEYSFGTVWNTIVASTPAVAGSYVWNIPSDSAGNRAKIRISDVSNPLLTDTSDANFTVSRLKLNTPLATDTYQAGRDTVITWSSSFVSSLRIEYSSNNGTNWILLNGAADASLQKYSWSIDTSLSSSQMRVRISDASELTILDSSQAFKVSKLRVISPNGGEQLQAGSTRQIYWSSGNITNVRIEYSLNDGNSWNTIVASTPAAAQAYSWTIPQNISSSSARIRITDASNNSITDISDNVFSLSDLVLTSPVGGEQFQLGKSYNITWTSNSVSGNLRLEYSSDAGVTWNLIAGSVIASLGQYNWLVSGVTPSSQVRIKITSVNNPLLVSEGADFTVSRLTLTSPVGGEFWSSGTTHSITWNSQLINNLNIYYSINNGTNWNLIANVPAATASYNWNIPANLNSDDMKIKLSDASNGLVSDSSSGRFKTGSVQLTSPNGGEIWQAGTTKSITWGHSANVATVRLDYSTDNGGTWNQIVTNLASSATPYSWAIPQNIASSNMLVRVSDAVSGLQILDQSDLAFTVSSLNIISPSGGEILQAGISHPISWSGGGGIAFLKIEFSTDNGSNWNLIDNNIPIGSSPYSWSIPGNTSTTTGLIRLSNTSDATIFSVSNSAFKVGNIVVTSPNGGERWQAGSTKLITWTASSSVSQVNIDYSIDNGNTYQRTIATNVTASLGSYSWSIDTTISSQVFVRVTDAQTNSTISDVNNLSLTISNLKSLNPTLAENVLSGSSYPLRWNNSGDVTSINLHYSTNNGTTWNLIANGVNPALGEYSWTVPSNISSSNSIVRIQDNNDISIQSLSKVFNIYSPTLSLLSPNGGEFINSGTQRLITWTSTQVGNVKLEYSLDNGSTWTEIISSYPADSARFMWSVGNLLSSTQARVRVSDAINPLVINDMSDAGFKIGFSRVLQPNGGENFIAGTTRNITWSASASVTDVRIDYSTNNGNVWIPIVNSMSSAPASYSWLVPNTPSINARVRVSDASSALAISDTSDLTFFITALSITSPNGGEELQSGKPYSITWNASNSIENISLEYSLNNGLNWTTIVSSVPSTSGSYTWSVAENITSALALIRIADVSNSAINDVSDAVFAIKRLRITAPNGGENWQVGTTQPITWISGSNIANVKLEFSSDNGTNWNFISNVVASNQTYDWVIPAVSSSSMRIRIADVSNNNISDNSDNQFKVGSITVLSPNGSEDLQAGTTKNITWTNSSSVATVNIQYSTNDGAVWLSVAENVNANSNGFAWTVPQTVTNQARVRVYDTQSNFTIKDSSDAVFTISSLSITSPIAGVTWAGGTTQTISWSNSSNIINVDIHYSTNGGSSWNLIVANLASNPSSTTWNVPANLNTNNALIRVRNSVNNDVQALSGTFTIFFPTLTLLSPNGGEFIQAGSQHNITWSSSLITNLRIEYSTNNGTNWNTIVDPTDATTGLYNWTVPSNLSSNQMLVRVSDQQNLAVTDVSDLVFNVGSVQLVTPTGGDRLLSGSVTNITWNKSSSVSTVRIEYSSNNGSTWNVVSASAAGTSLAWVVPSVTTDQARIRISDAASNLAISNTNSIPFTVSSITITSPNGNEFVPANTTFPITWNSSLVDNITLQYSTNNGTTWVNVVGAVNINASLGTYNWNVPANTDASNALVRAVDAIASNIADTSNASFIIGYVDLVYPNGNNIIQAGSIDTIRWNRSTSVGQLRIDYSTNGGLNWTNIVASTNAASLAYQWNVPSVPTSDGMIRISDANSNFKIKDSSDAVFIISALQVLTPNGNEELLAGTQTSITWNASSNINQVNIDLLENDVFRQNIASNVNSSSGNFNWLIPSTLFSGGKNFKIRISNSANSAVFDLSDSNFSVKRISITSPVLGDSVQATSTTRIRWTTNNITQVNIDYSTNNGVSWVRIFDTLSTNSSNAFVDWVTPNASIPAARIRIVDAGNSSIMQISDQFTIYRPSLQITSPNGGENWQAGRIRQITWSSSLVDSVRLEYSLDNGTTWNLINNNVNGSLGLFNWTIPDTLSSLTALVRITNLASTFISDVSDNPFTISRLELVSPNGGETWQAGTTKTISWNSSSNITNVRIEYSSNNGATWDAFPVTIVSAGLGQTTWNIPASFASSNMRIRISNASNQTISDSSSNPFRIGWVEIVSPNGGENLQAGKTSLINWNNSANISTVRLEYSIQQGVWL
ncbi:MAG: hypothetical protein KF721_10580, partial [Ignavibacteriaceae bacterium]|nr:hypothetical protein [Ignavibacteriaceae bacterium]